MKQPATLVLSSNFQVWSILAVNPLEVSKAMALKRSAELYEALLPSSGQCAPPHLLVVSLFLTRREQFGSEIRVLVLNFRPSAGVAE